MPLAALIIAGGETAPGAAPSLLPVVGQTLIEYQVRTARASGARHIVVLVDQMPAGLVAAFDRLRGDGIDLDVARDIRDAADRIHPDEQILLVMPAIFTSRLVMETLAQQSSVALLCASENSSDAAFERIDARDRWSGLALLNGKLLRETVAMLGDWSVGSTLLRRMLQSGAERRYLGSDDFLEIVHNSGQAQAASMTLLKRVMPTAAMGSDQRVIAALARPCARPLLEHRVPVDLLVALPFVCLGAALIVAALGWFLSSFVLFFIAIIAAGIATLGTHVASIESKPLLRFAETRLLCYALLLLNLAWYIGGTWTALILATWSVSQLLLGAPTVDDVWRSTPERGAVIMCVALIAGYPILGLGLLVIHGLMGQIAHRYFASKNLARP